MKYGEVEFQFGVGLRKSSIPLRGEQFQYFSKENKNKNTNHHVIKKHLMAVNVKRINANVPKK